MSESAAATIPAAPVEPSRRRRVIKIVSWILGLLVLLVILHLAGVDVWGWLTELWDTVTEISLGYVVLGCIFQGLQTSLTALGWYGILRYAYPGGVTYMAVFASYAAGVALNNFLPANIGTFVTLLMYVAIVQGATFPGNPRRATSSRRSSTSSSARSSTSTSSARSRARSTSSSGTSATRSRTIR